MCFFCSNVFLVRPFCLRVRVSASLILPMSPGMTNFHKNLTKAFGRHFLFRGSAERDDWQRRRLLCQFFCANNIFCHIHENQCMQGCCSHTLWQYSSNLQRKSNFENGSQIKGRDGETNYAQGLYVCFLQNLESRVAASREAHKEKSCQLAS